MQFDFAFSACFVYLFFSVCYCASTFRIVFVLKWCLLAYSLSLTLSLLLCFVYAYPVFCFFIISDWITAVGGCIHYMHFDFTLSYISVNTLKISLLFHLKRIFFICIHKGTHTDFYTLIISIFMFTTALLTLAYTNSSVTLMRWYFFLLHSLAVLLCLH